MTRDKDGPPCIDCRMPMRGARMGLRCFPCWTLEVDRRKAEEEAERQKGVKVFVLLHGRTGSCALHNSRGCPICFQEVTR